MTKPNEVTEDEIYAMEYYLMKVDFPDDMPIATHRAFSKLIASHQASRTDDKDYDDGLNFGLDCLQDIGEALKISAGDFDSDASQESCMKSYTKALVAASRTEWASVDDRLPEEVTWCLVVLGGYIQKPWYKYDGDNWLLDGDNGIPMVSAGQHAITHWQPLPLPSLPSKRKENRFKHTGIWVDSCDNCNCQEGGHYCLLHGDTVRDMNVTRCNDWEAKKSTPPSKGEE